MLLCQPFPTPMASGPEQDAPFLGTRGEVSSLHPSLPWFSHEDAALLITPKQPILEDVGLVYILGKGRRGSWASPRLQLIRRALRTNHAGSIPVHSGSDDKRH